MTWYLAGLWGMAGGASAALASLVAAVRAAGYRMPWSDENTNEERLARVLVMTIEIIISALVAAAASAQISGPWPAFIIGVGAMSTVRGLLAGVEVTERKPETVSDEEIASGLKLVAEVREEAVDESGG